MSVLKESTIRTQDLIGNISTAYVLLGAGPSVPCSDGVWQDEGSLGGVGVFLFGLITPTPPHTASQT